MPEPTPSIQAERARRIDALLRERLGAIDVQVIDESHLHRGHAGAQGGAGHFRVTVVSPLFAGISLLDAQRLVYQAVGEMMGGDIHALAITTRVP
jgi:BolA family transcriptional regulator, general stress-responsive regulator